MVFKRNDGFFATITNQHGHAATRLLKMWINIMMKISLLRQQRTFLIKCRRFDVLPSHIFNLRFHLSFTSNSVIHNFNTLKKRYQKTILNLEINDINCNLSFWLHQVNSIETQLQLTLPTSLITNFYNLNTIKITKYERQTKIHLIDKFNFILNKNNKLRNVFSNTDRNKWIVNISNERIPEYVLNVLSLGDKFALPVIPNNKIDRINTAVDIIKNIEYDSYKIPDNIVNETRSQIALSLHKFLSTTPHVNYEDRFIIDQFKKCKQFLCEHKDLLVTNADKGQVTVIMKKDSYINQMTTILSDCTTYRKLTKDPINRITTKVNDMVKSWRKNNIINEFVYKKLLCTNGNLPRCYGQPKIHKKDYPLRIIVSTLGSPLYQVSHFLHEILHSSLKKPKSFIKDSWTFAKLITTTHISHNEILVSLDVISLFTNIPTSLVIKAIENRWNDISTKTTLTLSQFLYAIELILTSTSFQFNGEIFDQIFGSPMGSPLSPILADIVMEDLETHCLQLLPFKISTFYRYVDDIFAIIPAIKIQDTISIFNSFHPRLQFTYETEKQGALSFLDTIVIRDGENLITNWFRKPTFSGRFINFLSHHPTRYKNNTISNLVDRAILLADKRFHSYNIDEIKKILINNNYPLHTINKHIKIRMNTLNNNYHNNNNVQLPTKNFISIPYIRGLSDNINRILTHFDITTLYSIPKKLNCIIKRGKDKLIQSKQTHVVYKIDCEQCDATYIGQTKRHVGTRIKEHRRDILKNVDNQSVVSQHRISCGHEFNWCKPKILHRETITKKREIAETFFIKKHRHTINLQTDTDNLTAIYDKIIHSI